MEHRTRPRRRPDRASVEQLSAALRIEPTVASGLVWRSGPREGERAGSFSRKTGTWVCRGLSTHCIVFALTHGFYPYMFQVRHADGDKSNNDPRNLYVLTKPEGPIPYRGVPR